MDTFEAIVRRRSIRRFKPEPVDRELITRLLEAARAAPSGDNLQPWRFVVVQSAQKRELLCEAAYGQSMFRQAPVVIVALGDRKVFRKRLRRGKELVDIGAVDADVMQTVTEVYGARQKDPAAVDRTILANCMIAIDHLTLAATSLGLGSCWVMLMKVDEVAKVLEIPEQMFPVAMVPIGYADQDPPPRPRYSLEEIAFNEELGRPWGSD
jgi:F420 biosynthesis protein FbiB-like protein